MGEPPAEVEGHPRRQQAEGVVVQVLHPAGAGAPHSVDGRGQQHPQQAHGPQRGQPRQGKPEGELLGVLAEQGAQKQQGQQQGQGGPLCDVPHGGPQGQQDGLHRAGAVFKVGLAHAVARGQHADAKGHELQKEKGQGPQFAGEGKPLPQGPEEAPHQQHTGEQGGGVVAPAQEKAQRPCRQAAGQRAPQSGSPQKFQGKGQGAQHQAVEEGVEQGTVVPEKALEGVGGKVHQEKAEGGAL